MSCEGKGAETVTVPTVVCIALIWVICYAVAESFSQECFYLTT